MLAIPEELNCKDGKVSHLLRNFSYIVENTHITIIPNIKTNMRKTPLLLIALALALSAKAQNTEIQRLSGTGSDDAVAWDFKCTKGRGSDAWGKIQVPSQWELQGFGEYTYGRFYMQNEPCSDEQGLYKRTFKVPASWRGKEVDIVFDGVMTDAEVKINGKSAGPVHQGAFYRFSYRITDLL